MVLVHKPAPEHTKRLIQPHEANLPLTAPRRGQEYSLIAPLPLDLWSRPVAGLKPGYRFAAASIAFPRAFSPCIIIW